MKNLLLRHILWCHNISCSIMWIRVEKFLSKKSELLLKMYTVYSWNFAISTILKKYRREFRNLIFTLECYLNVHLKSSFSDLTGSTIANVIAPTTFRNQGMLKALWVYLIACIGNSNFLSFIFKMFNIFSVFQRTSFQVPIHTVRNVSGNILSRFDSFFVNLPRCTQNIPFTFRVIAEVVAL